MLKKLILASIMLICASSIVYGQIEAKAFPHFYGTKQSKEAPKLKTKKPDINALLEEDRLYAEKGFKKLRFAKMIPLHADVIREGQWYTLENGDRVCLLEINAPEALSVSLNFSSFKLPKEAKLFVYNEDRRQLSGAYTINNNKSHQGLSIAPVPGDKITLEYIVPPGINSKGELIIDAIGYGYKELPFLNAKKEKGYGDSGYCNVDINCPEGENWQIDKRAILKIVYNGWLCTGSLVNNTRQNARPFFLTANHCIDNETEANAAIFYFNYESPFCDGPDGPKNQTISSATLRATAKEGQLDFTLLELSEIPPASYLPYYAGWNRLSNTPSQTVCIHHPMGDVKKITKDFDAPSIASYGGSYLPDAHWQIAEWDLGTTEGGSSGSPLFDENHRIIGDLTGGEASCSYNYNDFYSMFSRSWDEWPETEYQLKAWLDPMGTGVGILNGLAPYEAKPTNLIGQTEDTLIHLYWESTEEFLDKFVIFRDSIPLDSTSNSYYTDSLAAYGVPHEYFVRAVLSDTPRVESDNTNIIKIRTQEALVPPFTENFSEKDSLPDFWYEDFINDKISWTFQDGGFDNQPDSAYTDSLNANFYNINGAVTKLISPRLDLAGYEDAILSFYLSLPEFQNDIHHLYVYYKSADSLNWALLKKFTTDIQVWEKQFVPLSNLSGDYQIAFEAYGYRGLGISVDSVHVQKDTNAVHPEIYSDKDIVCFGNTVSYSTNLTDENYEYTWNFGAGAEPSTASGMGPHTVFYSSIGSKNVELTVNQYYTKTEKAFIRVAELPEKPEILVEDNTISTNYFDEYQWMLNGEDILGANQRIHEIKESGNYSVRVNNYYGCENTSDEKYVDYIKTGREKIEKNTLKVVPNPAKESILVQGVEDYTNPAFSIVTISGSVIIQGKYSGAIDISKLMSGFYILKITDHKTTQVIKFEVR